MQNPKLESPLTVLSMSNLGNPYLQWCEGDSLGLLKIIFKLTVGSSQIIKRTSHITTK